MAFNTGTINVSTTATLIIASNVDEQNRLIENVGSETIYIGGDNSVLTTTGFPLEADEVLDFGVYTGDIYGIVSTSTSNVHFMEDE